MDVENENCVERRRIGGVRRPENWNSVASCQLPEQLPVASCRLPVVGCQLPVAGCRSSGTGTQLLLTQGCLCIGASKIQGSLCNRASLQNPGLPLLWHFSKNQNHNSPSPLCTSDLPPQTCLFSKLNHDLRATMLRIEITTIIHPLPASPMLPICKTSTIFHPRSSSQS